MTGVVRVTRPDVLGLRGGRAERAVPRDCGAGAPAAEPIARQRPALAATAVSGGGAAKPHLFLRRHVETAPARTTIGTTKRCALLCQPSQRMLAVGHTLKPGKTEGKPMKTLLAAPGRVRAWVNLTHQLGCCARAIGSDQATADFDFDKAIAGSRWKQRADRQRR